MKYVNTFRSIVFLSLVFLTSISKANQTHETKNDWLSAINSAFGVQYEDFQSYVYAWTIPSQITLENYQWNAEKLMNHMDAYIEARTKRHAILEGFSMRLSIAVHFNQRLNSHLKALCSNDLKCLNTFDQIANIIPRETPIFGMLANSLNDEEIIADYLKFKKEFFQAESNPQNPAGGLVVLSKSSIQSKVYSLFTKTHETISLLYFPNSSEGNTDYNLTRDITEIKHIRAFVDLGRFRLHVYREFCATPIVTSLDLISGQLIPADRSDLDFDNTKKNIKRLPVSFFSTLVGNEELSGTCKKKIFGSPSVELQGNNQLKISYKEFEYKTFNIDMFVMGGGSRWYSNYSRKIMRAQVY